ncbi:hypothetical protein JCM18916_2227 [Cutibacterium acnes JCM 18916]|nr:hypothetical protein JCM18916_2227 [Cutibacterium acnes JCM 18916]
MGWIIATTVCGVLALSLPVRTVRRRCEADLLRGSRAFIDITQRARLGRIVP